MKIHTINTLKALSLYGKKKGKLVIAGCKAIAESYGIYLDPENKPTLCIYFNFKDSLWHVHWAMEEDPQLTLPKNVTNKVFIETLEKFIEEK